MNNQDLDLDIVDENFEIFSNFKDDENNTLSVDPNAVAGAVDSTATLIGTIIENQPDVKKELKARCGGKPWFGQEKKRLYEDCKENFYEQRAGVPNNNYDPNAGKDGYSMPPVQGGMSTGAIVGITLLSLTLIGGAIYFVTKAKAK